MLHRRKVELCVGSKQPKPQLHRHVGACNSLLVRVWQTAILIITERRRKWSMERNGSGERSKRGKLGLRVRISVQEKGEMGLQATNASGMRCCGSQNIHR